MAQVLRPGGRAVLALNSPYAYIVRKGISDYFASITEVYYTFNRNRTTFKDSVSGVAEPSFEKPNAVGFNATLQARF